MCGYVKWVPATTTHGASSVADGRDGLQIWSGGGGAANIFNKQSWTADKLWSHSLDMGRRANNSSQ
jgi:hypothetical protein